MRSYLSNLYFPCYIIHLILLFFTYTSSVKLMMLISQFGRRLYTLCTVRVGLYKNTNTNMSLVKCVPSRSFPNAWSQDHVDPGPWTVYGGSKKIKIKKITDEMNWIYTFHIKRELSFIFILYISSKEIYISTLDKTWILFIFSVW